jgi:hypothetical protein
MDGLKDNMKLKGVSMEMTNDRRKRVVPTLHTGIRNDDDES